MSIVDKDDLERNAQPDEECITEGLASLDIGRFVDPSEIIRPGDGSRRVQEVSAPDLDEAHPRAPTDREWFGSDQPKRRFRMRIPYKVQRAYQLDPAYDLPQWRYEEAVVKHILKHYKIPQLGKKLWVVEKKAWDYGRLTLLNFYEMTGFPIWLESRRIKWKRHSGFGEFLRYFSGTPIVKAFQELLDRKRALGFDVPGGLVFQVPKIKFLVLHNYPTELPAVSTRIEMGRMGAIPLTLEPLNSLLDALAAKDKGFCKQLQNLAEDL